MHWSLKLRWVDLFRAEGLRLVMVVVEMFSLGKVLYCIYCCYGVRLHCLYCVATAVCITLCHIYIVSSLVLLDRSSVVLPPVVAVVGVSVKVYH